MEAIKNNGNNIIYASELPICNGIVLLSIKNSLNNNIEDSAIDWRVRETLMQAIHNTLKYYNKSFIELQSILRNSKLTLMDARAQLFNISLNKIATQHTISVTSMSGKIYLFDITDDTINDIATKIYDLDNTNAIAFISEKDEVFDLEHFNKKIIDIN